MTDGPQQAAPQQKAPRANKIAACVMLGLGLIVGVVEWTHASGGRQEQQATTSHHSLHSATTTGSGS